jgi:ubiquitin-activating enzyme E1
MTEINHINNIDANHYDRQNRTFGIESTKLIQSSCVYIIGLKNGYASEICKNLALSGIKTLILFGDEIIDEEDKKNCMFYRNSKINSFCWEEIKKHINEINNSVHVEHVHVEHVHVEHVHDIKLSNATCVIINKSFDEALLINKQIRFLNGKTIYMVAGGLAGSIFVDANVNHQVFDTTGEIKEDVPIKDIINNNNNKSILICGKHNFNYGDKVKFINMVGENLEYYNNNIFNVCNTNNNSIEIIEENYKINESNKFKFINGSIKYVETKKCFHHFEMDYSQSSDIYKNLNEMLINNQCQHQLINKSFKYTFIPIISVMGGLVSTEVIKLVANKYTPISQWYEWSDFDIIKDYDNIDEEINNINNALSNNNILMVGCGALGCEWLKNLALMGSQNITIVDPDHIERSNLSRQFLFRNSHIGKSKCLTAIETINNMINSTASGNYNGIIQKLTSQDVSLANELFQNKKIIISALDNIEARRYVDTLCFEKCLPLFESGTMGMKCNTQPVIPYITETYSNTNDADDGENQFPVCTIKNFPNSIHHTIHWARDYFELFNRGPTNCNKYNQENNYLECLAPFDKTQAIEDINFFLTDIPQNYNNCIMKAKKMFEELYIVNILQLLKKFPEDHEIDGKLFWSHGKLCPKPLEFNNGIDFIINTANIFCKIYGIKINYDFYKNIITEFKFDNYNIEEVDVAKTDEEEKKLSSIIKEVELKENISKVLLNPQEFEKDEPENICNYNYHVDWVSAASNCRATNYGINNISKYETKGIAGKIIPAVATTTSTAVGLIALELLKYLNGINKIDKYRSWYMNMADNTIIYSEPNPISDIVINNKKLNGWTKFKYSKNTKLNEFIKYYKELFDVEIEMILYETAIIYAEFMDNHNDSKLLDLFLNEFNIDISKIEVSVIIMGSTDIPNINILLE